MRLKGLVLAMDNDLIKKVMIELINLNWDKWVDESKTLGAPAATYASEKLQRAISSEVNVFRDAIKIAELANGMMVFDAAVVFLRGKYISDYVGVDPRELERLKEGEVE